MTKASEVWLITGGSSGPNPSLALNCLERGIKVIATARNVSKATIAAPELEKRGGKWLELDVTQRSTQKIVRDVVVKEQVTCIVNSAGTCLLGAVEDISDEECQLQLETNLFGALRVIRGALPHFRERNSGIIINMSSGAGVIGRPGMGLYSASKFALEGVSEALYSELAPFNIKTLLVVLGTFRTPFANNVVYPKAAAEHTGGNGAVSAPYLRGAVNDTIDRVRPFSETAPGDPAKAAKMIVNMAFQEGDAKDVGNHLRLILGTDSMKVCRIKEAMFRENLDALEELAGRSDF
ncbi:short chain oxidoreductase/dehydrogenase [Myriangium duriaei CBS 260.36]|uniref:Short chain oxidoreductase/dehydrogenase n=1 Tax=Myriangium duriaei CBS 260.36 TaxID=1168546 RepID=A0A9P4IT50_9PEZI|nr:short chain oxidoreductase/dehydrogenase [Myriangium duriaei CBS 260.36]